MDNSNSVTSNTTNINTEDTKVIQTDVGAKDGQEKCPKCGSTDITLNVNTGKLRCDFCRFEFEPQKVEGLEKDISKLNGTIQTSGVQNIVADSKSVVTFKCSSCGAEVVVDTAEASQARCHWCRNMLSVNQQVPNGSIPDFVLPFKVKKEEAKQEIEKFVGKRKFFANPTFRKEFTTENIMGVYFPYILVDINSHSSFSGLAEKTLRTHYHDNNTTYDVSQYNVEREFDLSINGLTIESNSKRLNGSSNETSNIINAIMPFDVDNCVKYDSNFLKGYTSEKRDLNVDQVKGLIKNEAEDIARFSANESLTDYDRGVSWASQNVEIKGEQWKSAYLPVWLYSYQQIKGDKSILHYVAVNARTKETIGSVPIHMPKLIAVSALVEALGIFLMLNVDWDYSFVFALLGIIFFAINYFNYRNSNARNTYETETKKEIRNLRKVDNFYRERNNVSSPYISNQNNKNLSGQDTTSQVINSLMKNSSVMKEFNEFNNLVNKGDKK